MHISHKEARIHNLINRFVKNRQLLNKNALRLDDLQNTLFFREKDFAIAEQGNLLIKKGDYFLPTDYLKDEVERLHKNIIEDQNELSVLKKEYLAKFQKLNESGSYRPTQELIELAAKIHWHILPEYEEYMIVNSELYPNIGTAEYYNHYHTLEDLYKELSGAGKSIESKKGDMNLNQQVKIKIYSRRWGHHDTYSIERTLKGWTVTFHHEKVGHRDGDALTDTLKHDSINYPHKLGVFMRYLWYKADNNEMTLQELSADLNQIADWINICEKNTPSGIEV